MALMNLFSGQQWSNKHGEQTYGTWWEDRREKMYGENNIEIYNTMYKTGTQLAFAV